MFILSPKWDDSVKSQAPPNPELREPCGIDVRRSLRAKGGDGYQETMTFESTHKAYTNSEMEAVFTGIA